MTTPPLLYSKGPTGTLRCGPFLRMYARFFSETTMSDDTPTDDSGIAYEATIFGPDAVFYCEDCDTLTTEVDRRAEELNDGDCLHAAWVRVDDRTEVCLNCYPRTHNIESSPYGKVCMTCEGEGNVVDLTRLDRPGEKSPKEKATEMTEDDDIIAVLYRRDDDDTVKRIAKGVAFGLAAGAALGLYKRFRSREE